MVDRGASRRLQSLARVVIGGLVASTLVTLVLISVNSCPGVDSTHADHPFTAEDTMTVATETTPDRAIDRHPSVAVDPLVIADRTLYSRLILGSGKYTDNETMLRSFEAAGAEMVTVALRRVDLQDPDPDAYIHHIDPEKYLFLPNTAGCYTADEAIRTACLGRELGGWNWVKLEVIGDKRTLFPDNVELLRATEVLVAEGFVVLPYTNDDPVVCRRLEQLGAAAVMPLGAPIGSGMGVRNPANLRIIIEQSGVPVIVDAGVGTASDAAVAMELGADGVLMNTGIAGAADPVRMARAMKLAVEAGWLAAHAGRIPRRLHASASTSMDGLID